MFWGRGATGEMFEEAQLEEAATELTEKMLKGRHVDISNRKIHWSPDAALNITQSAEHIFKTAKPEQPITVAMIEEAIVGWLEFGDFYPNNLSEQQQDDLDEEIMQWIESHEEHS